MRLQQKFARPAVAAITALWLVLCGWLALRHDGLIGHRRDAQGRIVHAAHADHASGAAGLGDHHDPARSDIHGRRDGAEPAVCLLAGMAHVVAMATQRVLDGTVVPGPGAVADAPPVARSSGRVYRLAPKTSPPATRTA